MAKSLFCPRAGDPWHKWVDYWLRPPIGRQRELWDASIFLFLLSFVGYILTSPPPSIAVALAAPLRVITETQLGWGVAAASLFGTVCSYRSDKWLTAGYLASRIAAYFMCANFLIGMLYVAIDGRVPFDIIVPNLTSEQEISSLRSGFLYALIFGWAARRLARDNRAWWERP